MNLKNIGSMAIRITELFGAKAGDDWGRHYMGIIKHCVLPNGQQGVFGRIDIKDSEHNEVACASANSREQLGVKLDLLVLMVLDYGILDLKAKGMNSVTFGTNMTIGLS